MLDDFLKEIEELKKYKYKYESQKKDKQQMSNELFKLMTEKYNNMSYEQRVDEYTNDMCRCCRYKYNCEIKLPDDILKPIESDREWFPAKTSCKEFEWD